MSISIEWSLRSGEAVSPRDESSRATRADCPPRRRHPLARVRRRRAHRREPYARK